MKKVLLPVCMLFMFCFMAYSPLGAGYAFAQKMQIPPEKLDIIIYPSSAKVTATRQVNYLAAGSAESAVVVYLPGQTDVSSIAAMGQTPLAINTKPLAQDDSSDPIRLAWKEKINNAQKERDKIAGEIEALKSRIKFWTGELSSKLTSVAEFEKIDASMQRALKDSYDKVIVLSPQLEEADRVLKMAQSKYNQLPPSIEVTFIVPTPRVLTSNMPFTYSYNMRYCGWQPIYTLNALPDKGKIEFSFSAKIYQYSGFDWSGAHISLATIMPSETATPPYLDHWSIGQRPVVENKYQESMRAIPAQASSRGIEGSGSSASMDSVAQEPLPAAKPTETVFSTYSIWDLGSKDVPYAKEVVYAIKDSSGESSEESIAAKFSYMARPRVSLQAFLMADVTNKNNSQILPTSTAVFAVEGNTVGTGTYPPEEGEPLYFGADPLVVVKYTDRGSQTDTRGFIGKEQLQKWDYKFEIINKHKTAIDVKVEDSLPELLSAKINLKLTSSPMPKEDKEKFLYLWNLSVNPAQTSIIEHKLETAAPTDIDMRSTR